MAFDFVYAEDTILKQYGDKVSSVMDISLREGSRDEYNGDID